MFVFFTGGFEFLVAHISVEIYGSPATD